MTSYRFTVREHEEYGGLGLAPNWYAAGDPLGGMAAAHDILEHFPNDDGSTRGELLALGAAFFVRGEAGFFGRGSSIHECWKHVASDFPTLRMRSEWHVPHCPYRARVPAHVREWIRLCVQEIRESLPVECDGLVLSVSEEQNIPLWLAKGYAMARARYANSPSVAVCLFEEIETECDRALLHAQEGDEVTVSVNKRRCVTKVTHKERRFCR
jgi:hypothetical protein